MTDTSGNTLAYSYGTDGLRTEKTYTPVNGTEYYERYYYSESALCYIVYTGGVMSFLYDANGGLLSTNVNGTNYIYLKNAQGDIIGLADKLGNVVVEYTYDAWGNILSITGSLAGTLGQDNPFRYRSYCYDDETGLYSLQSRYYDPEVGRFISSDDTGAMLEHFDDSILATNLYSYCFNNPINYNDPDGEFASALAGGGAIAYGVALGGANFWNPVGLVVLGVTAGVAIGVGTYYGVKAIQNAQAAKKAKIYKINQENMNKKVKDILKTKKGSIKNAKPPKGSPGWESILELTLAEIYKRAQQGDPGFNYFKKLLTDGRFNK